MPLSYVHVGAYPLYWSYLLSYPLTWLLNRSASAIHALFRVEQATHADVYSSEELKSFVAASKSQSEIEVNKADMLHNLFELDNRDVNRVMILRAQVHCLDISQSIEKNVQAILDRGHMKFPLINSDEDDASRAITLSSSW